MITPLLDTDSVTTGVPPALTVSVLAVVKTAPAGLVSVRTLLTSDTVGTGLIVPQADALSASAWLTVLVMLLFAAPLQQTGAVAARV